MDLIRTGMGIRQTIKNVSRLREIVTVFAKHGFAEFFSSGVLALVPGLPSISSAKKIRDQLDEEVAESVERDWSRVLGTRLRKCFEELGPAFVKFGQLLSSREDLFPDAFIEEMALLKRNVKSVPFAEVKEAIELSLGKKIEVVFNHIDEAPIGTASIGLVYKAQLKNGKDVVLKVRRPRIKSLLETDFQLLSFLAGQAERMSEDLKAIGLARIITDFSSTLRTELNFNIEALNCQRLKENLEKHDTEGVFYIPHIYKEYTKEDLLVMEYLDGIPFSEADKLKDRMDVVHPKLEAGMGLFLKTFLQDGFFHADLHGGNFLLLESGEIGLLDFGLMGTLGKRSRQNFVAIIYALISYNFENLIYEFLDVADYGNIPDVDALIQDVKSGLGPYVGLTAQQTDFSDVLQIVLKTLRKHDLYLPSDWFVVFRALMTVDGTGRSLGLDLDVYSVLERDIGDIIEKTLSKDDLMEEAIWTGRDFLTSMRILPRHLKWFFREWGKRSYGIEIIHTGHEKMASQITLAIQGIGYFFLTGVFTVSGVLLVGQENIIHYQSVPVICWLFWMLALAALLQGLRVFYKTR